MANNMIKWIITNSASYKGLVTKDNNALYFLQDTQEIYRGATSFTESVIMVSEFPAAGAQGRVYINSATLEGKTWNGTAWVTVIKAVATTLTAATETRAVSGEAVKTYVASEFTKHVTGKFVEGISYDKATKDLKFTKNGAEQKVAIDGFVTGATYSGETGTLSFAVEGGSAIDITLPKDNFVESGAYDAVAKTIVLNLVNGGTVVIPAADLVDVNEFESTATVDLAADSKTGIVKANVKVSATAGNQVVAKADGLYVATTDISGKLNKVTAAKLDEIVTAQADGQVKVSGVKVGAATISGTPNANTVATEAAVSAIRATLTTSIDTKFAKSNVSTVVPASAAVAADDKVLSEKAALTAIEAAKNASIAKTSIATTVNADAPSASKVVSESALVASMSWVVVN